LTSKLQNTVDARRAASVGAVRKAGAPRRAPVRVSGAPTAGTATGVGADVDTIADSDCGLAERETGLDGSFGDTETGGGDETSSRRPQQRLRATARPPSNIAISVYRRTINSRCIPASCC